MVQSSKGEVTATVSHLQSLIQNAIRDKEVLPKAHAVLSIRHTSLLCWMSTHSTSRERHIYTIRPFYFVLYSLLIMIWGLERERFLLSTDETITMPVIVNPLKNLSTANMMKEEEKMLANVKAIPDIYDTSSIGLRPNLHTKQNVYLYSTFHACDRVHKM